MGKKKHKATDTKVQTEPRFIKFSSVQQNYLTEVRTRQVKEWGDALESVYRDLGIMEKIAEAPQGTYQLRQNDLSGLDFRPSPPPPPELTDKEKQAEALKRHAEEKKKAEALKKDEEEAKSKKTH